MYKYFTYSGSNAHKNLESRFKRILDDDVSRLRYFERSILWQEIV